LAVDVGFKFSKLPWTLNEWVRAHLTCAMGIVGKVNDCGQFNTIVL
jgi:hypothetical protein